MSPEQVARTLSIFDAFLSTVRTTSTPTAAAHPPLQDVSTAVTSGRGAGPAGEPAGDAVGDAEVTRVTAMPVSPAGRPITAGSDWEEPTHERPDIMRALAKSDAAQPDTDVSIALPKPPAADPRVEQASIIIEDDSLTEPEFRREDVLRAMAEHARPRPEDPPVTNIGPMAPTPPVVSAPPEPTAAPVSSVEEFAADMLVLVKYGHAAQAVREIDRWVKVHPEHTNTLGPVALSVSRAASRAARRG